MQIISYKELPDNYCIWSSQETRIIELEPCPFCGSRAFLSAESNKVFGYCTGCYAEGPFDSHDERTAIEKWNNRVNNIDKL